MPRFSNEERTVLIEIAETFRNSAKDLKIRGHLTSAIRKLRQSDESLTKREQARKS